MQSVSEIGYIIALTRLDWSIAFLLIFFKCDGVAFHEGASAGCTPTLGRQEVECLESGALPPALLPIRKEAFDALVGQGMSQHLVEHFGGNGGHLGPGESRIRHVPGAADGGRKHVGG